MYNLIEKGAKKFIQRANFMKRAKELEREEIEDILNNDNKLGVSNPVYTPFYLRPKETRGSGEVSDEEYEQFEKEVKVAKERQAAIDSTYMANHKQVRSYL